MKAFYNEIDAYCCAWLSNLMDAGHITPGKIDDRPIQELTGNDLRGYDRVHLFAGISGWELALQLAGWGDRPIWTGSCPCQPFSVAGNRKGTADERHLWPEMFRLIAECRPQYVIGEQVEGAVKHGWLDGVFTDLENENYTCGVVVLGAHSAGAPHIRQRLFWVADAGRIGSSRRRKLRNVGGETFENKSKSEKRKWLRNAANHSGSVSGMEYTEGEQVGFPGQSREQRDADSRMANTRHEQERRSAGPGEEESRRPFSNITRRGAWGDYELVHCADGKARRIESESQPLANGVSGRVAVRRTIGQGDAAIQEEHWYNRIGALRAFGNAIVPQTAAEFIAAFMECSP